MLFARRLFMTLAHEPKETPTWEEALITLKFHYSLPICFFMACLMPVCLLQPGPFWVDGMTWIRRKGSDPFNITKLNYDLFFFDEYLKYLDLAPANYKL